MSRIGLKPVEIPQGVTVKLDGGRVSVAGPLGSLEQEIPFLIRVEIEGQELRVIRENDSKVAKSLHGLIRSLIANMVFGVSKGFSKVLEIQGTGFRVKMEGKGLVISVGFSHQVNVEPVEGINFEVKGEREIIVSGVDLVLVGNIAAKIRKIKPPDAYKGKGIRYQGERVVLKPGKAGKTAA